VVMDFPVFVLRCYHRLCRNKARNALNNNRIEAIGQQ
jgi:hypothetical protein